MSISPSDSPSSRWSFGSVDGRRLADGVEHDEVVLAAGGDAVDDDVGDRHVRRGERLLGVGLLGLGGLDRSRRAPWPARAARAARPATPAPTCLLAVFCSARRLSAAEIAARRAASASSSASTRPGSSPRARCDARTASGFSRSSLRSITAATLLAVARECRPQAQPHNVTTASLVTAPRHACHNGADVGRTRAGENARRRGRTPHADGGVVAESARHIDPPRAAADRARRAAHRRACITALPGGDGQQPVWPSNAIALGLRGAETFDQAKGGDCLNWPEQHARRGRRSSTARTTTASRSPSRSTCGRSPAASTARTRHRRRRRASSRSARSSARPRCAATSATEFDPNSRFTVSMLWSGDKAWRQSGERRMLCGLQLPGPNNQQLAFKGKVADVDQSKVWPAGTCLGIDPTTNQPTDIPVDCAAPHAMEVTGAVNVAEKFPGGAAARARPGRVHQGRLHQDDRRLPGADPAAQHHADADLQHDLAAELVGGQPPGVVQHRRDARQRRLVDPAQQRQGPAADQRSAAGRRRRTSPRSG